MNKTRQEIILAIWEQWEIAKSLLDREFVIKNQELISEWAQKNEIDLNEISDLEALQEKLSADEEMVAKSKEISEEFQIKFRTMLFDKLIPLIDKSKIDAKDGILLPEDMPQEGKSIIIP